MVMMMIPHLVTGALPRRLAVQVEGASLGLIGFNPAAFSPASAASPPPFLSLSLSVGLRTQSVNLSCHFMCMGVTTNLQFIAAHR